MEFDDEYRTLMWQKSKEIVNKIKSVLDIEKIIVLGSFMTEKTRPADVDFIILLKTSDQTENWSTDIVFAPNNPFGKTTIEDAQKWMEEKYGMGNFKILEFTASEFK